jgi:dipeptidyl aminopeptidase/acylaminoacyl peptidase
MAYADNHTQPGPARTEWGLASVVLAVALLAVACTGNGGGPRQAPTQPSPAPASPAPAARTAASTPPADGLRGWIAYSTAAGDIWVMRADGSNRRQVTDAGGHDFDPSLSPDGRRVVFRTSRGHYAPDPTGTGVEGIIVVDLDGSHQREIQPPRGGLFPDWSPDGRRIALSTLRADGTETILTMHPDGTHVHDTGVTGAECAEWSPDSSRIAYYHHGGDGDFDVWVMDADGSDQQRLTSGADQESPAAWLPDGRIVYASFHADQPLPRWFLMDADGTNIRSLPQLEGAADPIDWLATAG